MRSKSTRNILMKPATIIFVFTLFLTLPVTSNAVDLGIHFYWDNSHIDINTDEESLLGMSDQLILESNEFFEESGIDVQLFNSGIEILDIAGASTSQILDDMSEARNEFSNIFQEADKHGADFIIGLPSLAILNNDGLCGRALQVSRSISQIRDPNRAIAVTRFDCGAETFAHEIGHLMGLAHGDQVSQARDNNAHSNGLTSFAKGWGRIINLASAGDTTDDEHLDPGEYATLMVGNNSQFWAYRTGPMVLVPLFSGVNNRHELCGTGICGNATNGDASRLINENRFTYAAHQEIDADHLIYEDINLSNCLTENYSDTEIIDLNNLICSDKDIHNLDGIEQLTSLSVIDLSNNRIVNLTSLRNNLENGAQIIDLTGNNSALCHQLETLDEQYPGRIIMPSRCLNIASLISALFVL